MNVLSHRTTWKARMGGSDWQWSSSDVREDAAHNRGKQCLAIGCDNTNKYQPTQLNEHSVIL